MNYVEVYKTVLNFHRRYSNITDTDEFWNAIVNESSKIAKQYDNCRFVRDLLLAVIGELERKAKEMRQNADKKYKNYMRSDECEAKKQEHIELREGGNPNV